MRRTQHTVLLVCEGYAEVEYARVIRDLYLPRGCGTALQPWNARGHGAANALDIAVQRQQEGSYDTYGILIDTDCHWTDGDRERARKHRIFVVENTPCLEATLLRADGQRTHPQTRDNKNAFEEIYNGPPHRDGVIRRHFSREKIDAARRLVSAIDQLLRLIRC